MLICFGLNGNGKMQDIVKKVDFVIEIKMKNQSLPGTSAARSIKYKILATKHVIHCFVLYLF